MRVHSRVAILAVMTLGAAGCAREQSEPSRVSVGNEISVTPATVALGVGARATLVARAVDAAGRPAGVRWSSASPAIATVSDSGIVTGRAMGSTTVLAASLSDSTVRAEVPVEVR